MTKEKIGKFIVELRRKNNMTQNDLAEKVFVTRTTVSKWENGKYIPSPEVLWELSKIFNVTLNELLAGEYYNEDNPDDVNKVVVDILKQNKKKIKKILLTVSILLTFLLMTFFTYYFMTNYNSIHVYKIYGESDSIYLIDGVMILSREKAYIKLGEFETIDNSKIIYYKLYFVKDDNQNIISEGDNPNKLLVNSFGYDELFSYDEFNELKDNLIIEVKTDNDDIYILKLNLKKDFSNKINFSKQVFNISNTEAKNDEVKYSSVPKFIVDNFEFDITNNEYYLNYTVDDIEINQKYSHDMKIYFLYEKGKKYEEYYEYSFDDCSISYSKIEGEKVIENFIYSLENNKCIFDSCDNDKIEYVKEKYLNNILVEY